MKYILFLFLLGALPCLAAGPEWKPLWDGQTLNGWHAIGKGRWTVEDGAIHGVHARRDGGYGHLVSDRAFTNFTVRLKFKALQGNSGFYFRSAEKGWSGVAGFQAEIDPARDTGGLYETGGRHWVVQPKPADVRQWFKPGEWNELTVAAHGGHVVVHVNGLKTAELLNDAKGRPAGKFAFQFHSRQDVELWVKEIEIREE